MSNRLETKNPVFLAGDLISSAAEVLAFLSGESTLELQREKISPETSAAGSGAGAQQASDCTRALARAAILETTHGPCVHCRKLRRNLGMKFGGSKRARKCVVIALSHQVTGQDRSPGAAAKSDVKRSLNMSSDGHSAPLCRHGQHVLCVQGMVPARKNKGSKGLSVWWWDNQGQMPTWLPLRGGKQRQHWEGWSKLKRAGGKSPVNEGKICKDWEARPSETGEKGANWQRLRGTSQ